MLERLQNSMAKNKQKKCPECEPGLPGWMATFSDLMALLLTFFVLLLSMSTMDKKEFEKAVGSLKGALSVLPGEPILTSPIKLEIPIVKGDITEARPTLKDAKAEIEEELEAQAQEENIEIIESEDGLTIRIKDNAIFDSGEALVKPEIMPILNKIGSVLAGLPNAIEIGGHTDNIPISSDQFRNNHWLSSARALSVLDIFQGEVGIGPDRLTAIGHGEFKPLVENDSSENRSMNRRVEIHVPHVETESGSSQEEVKRLFRDAQIRLEDE